MDTERTLVSAVRPALAAACPSLADGTAADAVAGVVPSFVASPSSTAEAAALLRAAAEAGLAVVPRTALGDVLARISALSEESGIRVANVFHAGDGNLHPLVLYNDASLAETEAAEELSGAILDTCIAYGGSITGEHGVGLDKSRYMPKMFTAEDLETMQLVRCAFDPAGLCNPGKVFPTPRLCGEKPGPFRPHPLEEAGVIERL